MPRGVERREGQSDESAYGMRLTPNKIAATTSAVASTFFFLTEPPKTALRHAIGFVAVVYVIKWLWSRPPSEGSNNERLVRNALEAVASRAGVVSVNDADDGGGGGAAGTRQTRRPDPHHATHLHSAQRGGGDIDPASQSGTDDSASDCSQEDCEECRKGCEECSMGGGKSAHVGHDEQEFPAQPHLDEAREMRRRDRHSSPSRVSLSRPLDHTPLLAQPNTSHSERRKEERLTRRKDRASKRGNVSSSPHKSLAEQRLPAQPDSPVKTSLNQTHLYVTGRDGAREMVRRNQNSSSSRGSSSPHVPHDKQELPAQPVASSDDDEVTQGKTASGGGWIDMGVSLLGTVVQGVAQAQQHQRRREGPSISTPGSQSWSSVTTRSRSTPGQSHVPNDRKRLPAQPDSPSRTSSRDVQASGTTANKVHKANSGQRLPAQPDDSD